VVVHVRIIGHPEWSDIPWKIDTVYQEMLKFDVCLIYTELNRYSKSKSLNRPLNAMILGLPVIASPIPSYYQIIKNEKNGFIIEDNNFEGFKDALLKLKDFNLRKKIGINARKSVIDKYGKEEQAKKYLAFFETII
jgi:glycosyltransferase involved in cell wall biosynthesis